MGAVAEGEKSYGVEVAFHNAFGPIQNAVTIQVDASLPNFLIQESFCDVFSAWKRQLVNDQLRVEDGYATVLTKPGLGVEVDEKFSKSAELRDKSISTLMNQFGL
jgi:L-alanine-DL-glutamate epimerase-like enolase superfamily enzyme